MAIPTIKVKHKKHGTLVINERDFDPTVHEKIIDKPADKPAEDAGKKKGA